jgi:hypothetical protein
MADSIVISKTLSIRDCGFDEYWLQEQIAADPSILGLGSLELVERERRQSSGGKLDLLLKNPKDDSMYEVEVMLGAVDESHIIRTIEYWGLERKRFPKRRHFAVLVAESVNRRFFDVIQLLSEQSISFIAIQVNVVEVKGNRALHFTRVPEPVAESEDTDDSGAKRLPADEWMKQAPWCVEVATALVPILADVFPEARLNYAKRYIRLYVGGEEPWFWLRKNAADKASFRFDLGDAVTIPKIKAKVEPKGLVLTCLPAKQEMRLRLTKDLVVQHRGLLLEIARLVKKSWNR